MFTRVGDSTRDEWIKVLEAHKPHVTSMPDRILGMLRGLQSLTLGLGVDQLHHALQTATMARRSGADEETVLISLLHDVGKVISVIGHGQICAEIIRPYVTDDSYHIIRTHQDFQIGCYQRVLGVSEDRRKQHEHEPWFDKAVIFSDEWDREAFDPGYDVDSLDTFEPLVRRFFAMPRFLAGADS